MLKKLYPFMVVVFVSFTFLATNQSIANTAARTPFTLTSSFSCVGTTPTLTLAWNNPNKATSFIVHRNPSQYGATTWAKLQTLTGTSYQDTAIATGVTYSYQIEAVGGFESRHTNILTLTVPLCEAAPVAIATTTSTRPIVTVSSYCENGQPRAKLNWTNPGNASSFIVHRNPTLQGTLSWGFLARVTATQHIDTTPSGGTVQYQVQTEGADVRYSDIASMQAATCTTSSATSSAPVPTVAGTSTAARLKWGAYAGWSSADMKDFETRIGKNPDHMAAFVHWGNANGFPNYMQPFTKDKNRTLIIFWEPSDHTIGGTVQPKFSADAILAGNWDSYIKSFAAEAKAYGAPVILIPFSEMNGNWNPWSGTTNGNTPEKVVAAYRHVRTVFGTVPNVQFGWAPNSVSVPDTATNAISKYYPGDAYVDIVGVDGFNFNTPWLTFDQIFGKSLATISAYKKPMYIFSFASAQGTQKAAWITDAITVQMKKYPLLQGFVWFNQNKEKDWRIWSDTASLTAFKNALP